MIIRLKIFTRNSTLDLNIILNIYFPLRKLPDVYLMLEFLQETATDTIDA